MAAIFDKLHTITWKTLEEYGAFVEHPSSSISNNLSIMFCRNWKNKKKSISLQYKFNMHIVIKWVSLKFFFQQMIKYIIYNSHVILDSGILIYCKDITVEGEKMSVYFIDWDHVHMKWKFLLTNVDDFPDYWKMLFS